MFLSLLKNKVDNYLYDIYLNIDDHKAKLFGMGPHILVAVCHI